MKRILIVLFFCANSICYAQQAAVIKGEIKGLGDEELFISKTDAKRTRLANVDGRSGEFHAVLDISELQEVFVETKKPTLGAIMDKELRYYFRPRDLKLFVSPGDTIEIRGDSKSLWAAKVSGGKYQREYQQLQTLLLPFYKKEIKLKNKQYKFLKEGNKEKENAVKEQYEKLIEKERATLKEYYLTQTEDMYAFYTFSKNIKSIQPEKIEEVYNAYDDNLKESSVGKEVLEYINNNKFLEPGKAMLDFKGETLSGLQFDSKELRGKYVLLDFWGSWCMPCRKGNPKLKELYEKYKNQGFEIVGIGREMSKDRNAARASLEKAVLEDDLPWIQFLHDDLKDRYDLLQKYNVHVFPTKVLIDDKGIIKWKGVGVKDNLEEVLQEVFQIN